MLHFADHLFHNQVGKHDHLCMDQVEVGKRPVGIGEDPGSHCAAVLGHTRKGRWMAE